MQRIILGDDEAINGRIESPHSAHVTGSELIDELTYISYVTNRDLGIPPEGFKRMGFSNVDAMEHRYQEKK